MGHHQRRAVAGVGDDDVPELAADDPRRQELDAYIARMATLRDQFEARCAQMGWHLGLLPTDPITGEVPGPAILTKLGFRQVELQKASCATYLITESTALHLIDPEVYADPGTPGTWCIAARPFDLHLGDTDPWLLGSSLICVPPTPVPEDPAPAESLVLMNSDGVETQLETPTGPARLLLLSGYTYLLIRDRVTERWSIREVVNTGRDWTQLLTPPWPGH